MPEETLLSKIRAVGQNFLEGDSQVLDIDRAVISLGRVIKAAIFVLDLEHAIRSRYPAEQGICDRLEGYIKDNNRLPEYYDVVSLQAYNESRVNVPCTPGRCPLVKGKKAGCSVGELFLTAVPILGDGQRAGTLILLNSGRLFKHDDIILAEIGAAVIGLLLMRLELGRQQENARNKSLAAVAFDSLSYSEVEAMDEILKNLTGEESIIITSKIADELGITRSVIVNALRKFESAGIIESRSLGMKGTYVRVSNPQILEEIKSRISKMKHDNKTGR